MMKIIYLISIVGVLCACNAASKKKQNEKEKTMKCVTFDGNSVSTLFAALPDSMTDLVAWEKHYQMYPERWEQTFDYLAHTNLDSLPLGRIELSEDVYITISEYETKEPGDALYEAHRKYIDIQYLISGSEYIGILRDTTLLKEMQPYNEEKDIAFYTSNGGTLRKATPGNFFIFFPQDVHRPCVKEKEQVTVKKLVVKMKVD